MLNFNFTKKFIGKWFGLYLLFAFSLIHINSYGDDNRDYLGFIENDTKTIKGYKFYQSFSKVWYLSGIAENINIIIREDISRGSNSLLKIQYNNRDIYHLMLNAKHLHDREYMQNIVKAISQRLPVFDTSIDGKDNELEVGDYE